MFLVVTLKSKAYSVLFFVCLGFLLLLFYQKTMPTGLKVNVGKVAEIKDWCSPELNRKDSKMAVWKGIRTSLEAVC